ncbi:hypothetical protein CHARACLAT_008280 [Characodon lateralis]|uniref:Uncharacterized protein n=1 Tax=Characodon lateralis TaxID=208331 RepID=A0ABU7D8J0_9TELE|nr:hypothetical protein [Characodon lateralis]
MDTFERHCMGQLSKLRNSSIPMYVKIPDCPGKFPLPLNPHSACLQQYITIIKLNEQNENRLPNFPIVNKSKINPKYFYICIYSQDNLLRLVFSKGNLHLLWTKCFGLQDKKTKTKIPQGVILTQQEELSEKNSYNSSLPSSPYPVPAAVPLLSMSQISNDRCVCAGCTKRACL